MQGKLISFEGPEGSGKSTQIRMLSDWLTERGITVCCTREPGGTALGEAVREILQHNAASEAPCIRAELLLFEASRAQLVEQVIVPALERGEWVLCDRFIDSTLAYQGFGRGLVLDELSWINRFSTGGLRPHLTFLLDLEVEKGFERVASRYTDTEESKDRFEEESLEFHRWVRDGYLQIAEAEPGRFRLLDSSRSIEETAAQIRRIMEEAFFHA